MNGYESLVFDQPKIEADGYGGQETTWTTGVYACRGHFRYLRGSEPVIAARLSGVQPVVVTIRNCAASRAITPDWRMRDARRGTIYNIRTAIPSDDRLWIEITAESGVST